MKQILALSYGSNAGKLAFLMIWVLCSGCGGGSDGPSRVAVTGTVTFDGTPIQQGAIVFVPTDGHSGPSAGGSIVDGKFTIDKAAGPVPGPHRVEVRATRVAGTTTVKGIDGANGGLSGGGTFDKIEMYIPEKYNAKSTLKEEITEDDAPLTFELTS